MLIIPTVSLRSDTILLGQQAEDKGEYCGKLSATWTKRHNTDSD